MIQKSIWKFRGRIGCKADACIIRGPKLLPTSIRRNINQFNKLHGEETNEPPIEWNIQHLAAHLKYMTSTNNISPVVSSIMGRLNHNDIDNGDSEVQPSDFPVEFNSEYFPYSNTTPIESTAN